MKRFSVAWLLRLWSGDIVRDRQMAETEARERIRRHRLDDEGATMSVTASIVTRWTAAELRQRRHGFQVVQRRPK